VDLLEDLVDVQEVCHCCLVGNTSVGVDLHEALVVVRGVCHCLVGHTSIRVDLLEDLVDVQGVCYLGLLTIPYTAMAIQNTVHIQLPSILATVLYAFTSAALMVWYGVQDGHQTVLWVITVKKILNKYKDICYSLPIRSSMACHITHKCCLTSINVWIVSGHRLALHNEMVSRPPENTLSTATAEPAVLILNLCN
jgi:hypothetical protein